MILICEDCGKKYRIDPDKISGPEARFRCKNCSFVMVVKKPAGKPGAPEVTPGAARAAREDAPAESAAEPAAPPRGTEGAEAPEALSAAAAALPTRKGFGLTGKVTAVMLAVSLLPLLAFSGVALQQTQGRMRAEQEAMAAQVTSGLASQVDEWIDKNVRALRTAARLPDIVGMDPAAQEVVLKALHQEYPWMYLTFTLDPAGANVARNDGEALRDYSDRLYYRNVAAGSELAWQTVVGKTSKKPALVLAVPIRRDDRLVGVMAAAMTLDQVSDRVAAWTAGETGFAFLVDETGKVVAHQVASFVQEEKNLGQHPLVAAQTRGSGGALTFRDDQGRPTIGYVQGTSHGWALAIQQAESEAFRPLRQALYFFAGVLAVTVLGVLVVASFWGRALVTPIRTLTNAANRISVGELDTEVAIASRDELGDLADAIGRMQDSIRLSLERLRRRR